MPPLMMEIFAFLFGSVVGSFANVCIYRLPRDLEIIRQPSHCSRCGVAVAPYDNIPILSFLLLRGRCRHCGTYFGLTHFLVELGVGGTAWYFYHQFGLTFFSFYYFALTTSLIVASLIDLEHRIIPDGISIPGIFIGLGIASAFSLLGISWNVSWSESLLGVLLGGGLLWGVGVIYEHLTSREGIGFGDVKLLAFFGAHVGTAGVLGSLLFGSLLGSVVGVALLVAQRKGLRTPIPFGPYLCLGLLIYALGGHTWVLATFF